MLIVNRNNPLPGPGMNGLGRSYASIGHVFMNPGIIDRRRQRCRYSLKKEIAQENLSLQSMVISTT